ncbi:MAG TPA: alkaline phosphatase family protein [Thermodesulfobacteriota bacterium]|nr:alkaline phosphatase family protein [Thermodesulfobacteriota bacterium]
MKTQSERRGNRKRAILLISSSLLVILGTAYYFNIREPEVVLYPVPSHPIILVGVDGLEWEVMLPMIKEGRLPIMTKLMKQGVFGKLQTSKPTISPVIWTSIATAKTPKEHGIKGFTYSEKRNSRRKLYTNGDRKTKAFWNILTDHNFTVHCVGWWMTFPVDRINGIMVAQTNTSSQINKDKDGMVWKGGILKGLPGQVHPDSLQNKIMAIAEGVESDLPLLTESIFGKFVHPISELNRNLWSNTQWAFRADAIYLRVAEYILESGEPYDLLAIYFGGTDVVGHRFWRYMRPDDYRHRPTDEEIEDFGDIIEDYYTFIDTVIGQLLGKQPVDTTIFIISDHGMYAVNRDQFFSPNEPFTQVNSGHHHSEPPGVIIAAGRYIRPNALLDHDGLNSSDLPVVGSIYDITPTILTLKGIPVGSDMKGKVLKNILDGRFLEKYPVKTVKTHDTNDWLSNRPRQVEDASAQEERMEQLRSLGYIQ